MRINPVKAILLACVFNVISGVGIFYARSLEPDFSVLAGVFLRIVASFSCFIIPFILGGGIPRLHSWKSANELWLWGFFGLFTLSTYYYAVTVVGAGVANIFNAGSGLLITGLLPVLTNQKASRVHQWASAGCALGIILIFRSGWSAMSPLGLVLALASGIFSALAYIMVAKSSLKHSPETVLLHWTAINLAVVGAIAVSFPLIWPQLPLTWILLMGSAFLMAWSQYFTATAYQGGRASLIACLTFCGPLLSLILDMVVFGLPLTPLVLAGAALILIFGLIVPLKTQEFAKAECRR